MEIIRAACSGPSSDAIFQLVSVQSTYPNQLDINMSHTTPLGKPHSGDRVSKLRYRLALDIGVSSLGWAMIRLTTQGQPCAIIRAGVRVFSDGRNPKNGSSLAVTRRNARGMSRRRDRLLRRKARMMRLLVELGFFPANESQRKALELLNPYQLRARGLDKALTPHEFGRALFHINQRRGFRSNRRTEKPDTKLSPLKQAITQVRDLLDPSGADGKPRTVGELLFRRLNAKQTVRARYRETRVTRASGKAGIDKNYDLYLDRAMTESEFDLLWTAQASRDPGPYTEAARLSLKDCLLHQRPLRPVRPGRCTLLPEEERAPRALPSTQRFRIYQEVNNLRLVDERFQESALTVTQRDLIVDALERHSKRSFGNLRTLLGLPSTVRFNLEDPKRRELKGNATSALLAKKTAYGARWYDFTATEQDTIVERLLNEEEGQHLIPWLCEHTGCDDAVATQLADTTVLPDGYGNLSVIALQRILPHLQSDVISFAEATRRAGFPHSQITANEAVPGQTFPVESVNIDTGEVKTWQVFHKLPYYGEALKQHVGFGTGKAEDPPEQRFGRIANPTVHVGLNQVRTVINALLQRYGHPTEVIVEVARDLKQSREDRKAANERQAVNQRRNDRLRAEAATVLGLGSPDDVTPADIQKLILWEELNETDVLDRRCPYSGTQISLSMALSPEVEIEHILPFSGTLDNSLNNKTVAIRLANRIKGNRTPWEARDDFASQGWAFDDIITRVAQMPTNKRYRFTEQGYARWLGDHPDFLSRALNDTRYLSRVARTYVRLICPQDTRVIPGRMTALLRGKFGLNGILGHAGKKNREDHRHHAVDACVIGVTDQGMFQRFSGASASARERQLSKLVETMPLPWATYRAHVERAVTHIWVSHKPDHSHEGAMHDATAYALLGDGRVSTHKRVDGVRQREVQSLKVIPISDASQARRHGTTQDGSPQPYKGYKGNSNYCMDVVRTTDGKWAGEVVSTFDAYQAVRRAGNASVLRHPHHSLSGHPLVMRLVVDDCIHLVVDGSTVLMRVVKMGANGVLALAKAHEANVDARNRGDSGFRYTTKSASSLRSAHARRVTISPIGDVRDPGFRE